MREQKPALYPTWAPVSEISGSAGGPSAGGAYAGVGLYPGYGYPAQPVASAPRVGRSRAAFRGLALLVFVALVGVGAFLYLRSESAQGLGSGTHTLSAPATLGGQAQITTGALATLSSQVESEMDADSGVTGSVFGLYGSAAAGTPAYILAMGSATQPVTASTLSQAVAGFNVGDSGNFDLTTAAVSSASGVDFHCGPLDLSGATGAMCVWVDGNVIGMVIGSPLAGSSATLAAAEEARNTAEH